MESIKEYVAKRKKELHNYILEFNHKYDLDITLAIIQVGDNPASNAYVAGKMKDCKEIGITSKLYRLSAKISEKKLLSLIDKLNKKHGIDGIIVQLPLPDHISAEKVKLAIVPEKDVDGFHPLSEFVPCTPKGIVDFLEEQNFKFQGKHAVIIGRSAIVGKPMYAELLKRDCTVTQMHSKTSESDFKKLVESADIIVCATGHRGLLTSKYNYKKSAIIIDVGINKDENGKLCGDCEPGLNVAFQSPVPGGVGLLTRLALVDNTIKANVLRHAK